MAKRDAFVANGIRIETARDWTSRWFVCWKPNVSIYCRTRKEVLKFAAWPTKTPTGDALRAWLDSLEAMDAERKGVTAEPVGDANVEGSFDPLAHEEEDPALSTKMVL